MDENIKKEEEKKNGFSFAFLDYLKDFAYMVAGILLVFLLFFRIAAVDGTSMVPTLQHGDRLFLVSNLLHHQFQKGDVVVIHEQEFSQEYNLVKRVIATEGQTVDIDFDAGTVYVDGLALEEPYVNTPTNLEEGVAFPVTVPENSVFVLGDNRNNSKDSRDPAVGFVDQREIFGKALFIYLPGADKETGKINYSRIGAIR